MKYKLLNILLVIAFCLNSVPLLAKQQKCCCQLNMQETLLHAKHNKNIEQLTTSCNCNSEFDNCKLNNKLAKADDLYLNHKRFQIRKHKNTHVESILLLPQIYSFKNNLKIRAGPSDFIHIKITSQYIYLLNLTLLC